MDGDILFKVSLKRAKLADFRIFGILVKVWCVNRYGGDQRLSLDEYRLLLMLLVQRWCLLKGHVVVVLELA